MTSLEKITGEYGITESSTDLKAMESLLENMVRYHLEFILVVSSASVQVV